MNKEKILSDLERDSFNGQITIDEFRKRVKQYAEIHHTEQCNLGVVGKRTFLNDDELKEARQKIWNYLNEQHDVILLESDVDEILLYAKAID